MSELEDIDVSLLKFSDDGRFWASLDGEIALQEIESHVAECVRSVMKSGSDGIGYRHLGVGDLCIVQHGSDTTWSRAEVVTLLTSGMWGTRAELYLIDRGVTITVPSQRLCPLPDDLLQYPALAQQYTLAGVTPCKPYASSTLNWGEAVMSIVDGLVGRGEGGKVVAHIDPSGAATLFCELGETKINFNEYLVLVQLARVCDTEPAPSSADTEVVPDLVEEAPQTWLSAHISMQQKTTIQQFKPPPPPKFSGVYVESELYLKPVNSLSSSRFPPIVCKELSLLGFRDPTAAQGYGWPYVSSRQNVVLVSPPSTGKTLAYLLPLLTIASVPTAKNTIEKYSGPSLIVLVSTSWQARSVHIQSQKILSWFSTTKKFRCCCAYNGAEVEATHQLINGVDVMACTPPALIRLMQREILDLNNLQYLVFDDGNSLGETFPSEVRDIMSACAEVQLHSRRKAQTVIAASHWSGVLKSLVSQYAPHATTVFTCAIETFIKAGGELKVVPCRVAEIDTTLQRHIKGTTAVVVCASTAQEANSLLQVLQLHSWSAVCVADKEQIADLQQLLSSKPSVLILSDEVLPHMLDAGLYVERIVHYDLPSTKTEFRQRLALFYKSMKSGGECCTTVLLTERCQPQSVMLKQVLERMGQPLPLALGEMARNALKDREEKQHDFDLCYHLKAWGLCKLDKCSSPHKLLTPPCDLRPERLRIPVDGSVKVKVCHVSNASRLWVSLLQHSPLHRGEKPVPCHDPSIFVKLTMELAQFYSKSENKALHVNPLEGAYCGYQDNDGCYYRVRVMKFSQPLGLYFHHKEQARVRLLDMGCVRVVDVNQLLTLPEHFVRIPVQVVEAYICGVKPWDRDQDWPEEVVCYSREVLHRKVLHGRVALSSGETLWLDPVEHRVTLKGINVTTALSNPRKKFVKNGLAEPNPDHLTRLVQTLGITMCEHQPMDDRTFSYVNLALDCSVEVFVSAVCSPDLFYVQLPEYEEILGALEEELNADHSSPMSLTGVGEGEFCVARFPLDSRWYRGQVLTADKYQLEVFFLDYGDTEWVPSNMVQPIDPSLLKLPFQAVECSLKASNIKWSPEAGDLLWEWTRERVLLAQVVDTCSSKLPGCTHYVIELYEGGDSMAQRLPKIGPHSEQAVGKQDPSPGGILRSHISLLLSSPGEVKVHVAVKIQSIVIQNPRIRVTSGELASLCQLLQHISEPTCTPLLRTLSCLAAFQKDVCECLAEQQCLKHILPLLKSRSPQLLELELILLKMLLPAFSSHSHEVLCSGESVTSLCSCLRRRPSVKIMGHVLDVLSFVLEENRKLCQDVCEAGCVPNLCQVLSQSPSLHPSCLRILNAMATKTEGVTEVRKHLPINSLCKLLGSDPEVQVVQSVVQLLQPLCSDPLYKHLLLKSPLPRAIQHLPCNNAIMCLLLQDVCSALNIHPSAPTRDFSHPSTPTRDFPHPSTPTRDSPHPSAPTRDFPHPSAPTRDFPHPSAPSQDSPPPLIHDGAVDARVLHCAAPPSSIPSSANAKEHVLRPRVLWSQGSSHVLLAVQLRGCRLKEVKLGSKSIQFWACASQQNYGFNLGLYEEIDPQASSDRVTGSEVLIRLAKREQGLWPRLTELRQKLPFVSVDFDRWGDSSPEQDEAPVIPKSEPLSEARVRKQVPHKPQLYKDFLLPEQDTSSSEESEGNEDDNDAEDRFLDFD